MTTHDILDHLGTGFKYLLDALSISVVIGAVVQLLPPIAAGMSILWLGLQMFTWFRRKGWQTDEEKARNS
jgi:xanthine/uracil permease